MAKKKDIASLLNGIMGNDPAPLPSSDEQGNIPKETAEALEISPDLEEKLNAVRREDLASIATTSAGSENLEPPS